MDKYLNYATIGYEKMTATFSDKGELLRLFYPTVDYKQFVEWLHVGMKINDSMNIWLHDDENNIYKQNYIENTNILQTEIINTYFNVRITQTDFVPIHENLVVRNYVLKNESNKELNINLLFDSNILTNINNDTCGYVKNNALIQYNHDYTICLFSKENLLSYQINNVKDNIGSGQIGGKDYVGLTGNSAISYDLRTIKPGKKAEITVYMMVIDNNENNLLIDLDSDIERVKSLDDKKLFLECKDYWEKFVDRHDTLGIRKTKLDERIKKIYLRTILLFPIIHNKEVGGISAGIEVDEWKTKSGRYSYCWPRDGVFITKSFDMLNMVKSTSKFYNVFCRKTQNKEGNWEQRFYTDGRLAPSWGYQVDETASVVIGLYDHYLVIKDIEFLKENEDMIKRAVNFLKSYIEDVFSGEFKMQKSYDLWEENEVVSLYSLAAIYSAFKKAFKMNIILNRTEDNDVLEEYALKIQKYISDNFFNEEKKTFVRNLNDNRVDSSILGLVIPFELIEPDSRQMKNTVQKLEMTIRTHTGGFLRYENDTYMGGNPWVISTLWMALYYIEVNEKDKAIECLNFVLNTCTEHGFLSEQIDNKTMTPIWVIGLAWSHAMFIITLQKMLEKGMLN